MSRFWSAAAVQLGRRAGLVSVIGLALTVALGLGITRLEFATGQDSYLNADDQVAIDNVAYQELFGGQLMLVLFTMDEGHTVAELLGGSNRDTIAAVAAELSAHEAVDVVLTPMSGVQFSHNLLTRSIADPATEPATFDPLGSIASAAVNSANARDPGAARSTDLARTVQRVLPFMSAGVVPSMDDPAWIDVLLYDNTGAIRKSLATFFPSERHALMFVRLVGNADIETEGRGSDAVIEAWAERSIDGATVTATGAPALLKDINDYLRGGIVKLGALAIVGMALILLLGFRVRWRLLSLGVVLVGVVWAFGLAGYLGIPLSIVTIAALPVMLGIGIDFALQLHARVEEEVVVDRGDHPIQETARNLGPALLVVMFDALFAFAALRWAKVPMIRSFALLLCIGVAVICLTSIVATLAALGARERRAPTVGRDFRAGALGRLVAWLGSLPPRLAPVLVAGSALLFAGGLAVEGRIVLQSDPVQWVDQSSQTRRDIATLESEINSSSLMGVYVTGPTIEELFSDENVAYLHAMTAAVIAEHPDDVQRASSIVTPLSYLTEVPDAGDVAPTGAEVHAGYLAAPPELQHFLVAAGDDPALNVMFTITPGTLEQRVPLVEQLRAELDPPGDVRATPSGLLVVGIGLLENLEANRAQLTYLALGLVFAFLCIRLRSVVRALLSLVPVLIAVGAASLVAFTLGLKLSPMTALGGPLVIAVCTEFTSLILLRFIEERRRGLAPRAAADVAAARTGRAFIVSALTAVCGVAVIATSSLPLLRDFGIVVAMNVLVALAAALTILPPLMVWADQRNLVSRGLVDADVLRHATRTGDDPPMPTVEP